MVRTALTGVRSAAFLALYVAWTTALAFVYLPLMLLPRPVFWRLCLFWAWGVLQLARLVAGIRYEVRGRENLPPKPFLVAAKHQSVLDTLALNFIFDKPCFIMKRELLRIPFVGWFLWRVGMIAINRAGGMQTIRQMVEGVRGRLADSYTVIIFPEGTRTVVGRRRRYLPGAAALYLAGEVPVVPMALNSGYFWPTKSFWRYPGRAVFQILPPIPPGLDRVTFMTRLESEIEGGCAALEAEMADLNERRTSIDRGGMAA